MKKVMMTLMAVVFAITANAQYNTNYYAAARAVQRLAPIMEAERLPSTMTSMEATSVRQRPDRTMVEAPPQPITISTAIASVLVPAGE